MSAKLVRGDDPFVSLCGTFLCFISNDQPPSISVLDRRNLTVRSLDVLGYSPTVSSDGRFVCFEGDRVFTNQIQLFHLDSGRRESLVSEEVLGHAEELPDGWLFSRPALSPDGQRILFTACVDQESYHFSVFLYDRASGEVSRVTFGSSDVHPAWAPDGNRFVFAPYDDTLVISTLGGSEEVLRFGAGVALYPAWSHYGGSIAFAAFADIPEWGRHRHGKIAICHLAARGFRIVSQDEHCGKPAWAPGDELLVYVRDLDGYDPEICSVSVCSG